MTVMRLGVGTLSTVKKGLVQRLEDLEIKGRVENIETTALLRSVKIPRVPETNCFSESSGKQSAYAGVNNYQKSEMIMTIFQIYKVQNNSAFEIPK